jgi:hypothetical protein
MNCKLIIAGILCNIAKAFDYVNHNTSILLAKLKFYRINGSDYALYKSYLENGYQKTALYNKVACSKVSSSDLHFFSHT